MEETYQEEQRKGYIVNTTTRAAWLIGNNSVWLEKKQVFGKIVVFESSYLSNMVTFNYLHKQFVYNLFYYLL